MPLHTVPNQALAATPRCPSPLPPIWRCVRRTIRPRSQFCLDKEAQIVSDDYGPQSRTRSKSKAAHYCITRCRIIRYSVKSGRALTEAAWVNRAGKAEHGNPACRQCAEVAQGVGIGRRIAVPHAEEPHGGSQSAVASPGSTAKMQPVAMWITN
jgi:hypothetical protein